MPMLVFSRSGVATPTGIWVVIFIRFGGVGAVWQPPASTAQAATMTDTAGTDGRERLTESGTRGAYMVEGL
ncbi:MAG: hypothetical protein ACYTF9_10975, partial [Planctomycetota bacterium]